MTRFSRRQALSLPLLLTLAGCRAQGGPSRIALPFVPAGGAGSSGPIRVLMLTATAGFRHDSIPAARQAMTKLAADTDFRLTATEDLSILSAESLASYDVLVFCLTSGELALTDGQKAALLAFVQNGKGFIGVHSASDTLYSWPAYGDMLGAYFKEHPWVQPATVIVEDQAHPTTLGLPARFPINEEFYTFRRNPRGTVHVILRLDAASIGDSGDYPLAWCKPFGNGRVYYNALGHYSESWNDPRFLQQLAGAVRFAGGVAPANCAPG